MCNVFSLSSSPDEASFADQHDLNPRLLLFIFEFSFIVILNINQTLFILLQYFSSKLVSLIMFKLQFPGYVQRRGQVKSKQLNPKITIAYFEYLMITLLTLSSRLLQQCQPSSWSWGGQTPKRAKEWWRGRRVRMFPFGAAKKYKKNTCIF